MKTKKTFWGLLIAFTGLCVFLFYTFYNEAKNTAIKNTNETQMVYAKLAARGIEGYFETWVGVLDGLSEIDDIINNNADGERLMKALYKTHIHEISAVTRVDENGKIIYSSYGNKIIGTDISDQKHIHELLKYHKTIISDVFASAEGVSSIALHVPVFKGTIFKGSISILVNFENVTKHFLSEIKIGKTGHAWAISRDGIELYSPNPNFVGKPVSENLKGYPTFKPMLTEMLKGHQGYTTYLYDRANGHKMKLSTKLAVYVPVHLENTFWSIAVVSNENEALSGLVSFRNRLILIILVFFIFGMIFITYSTKAWLIVKEENKRKQAEALLKESEKRYRNIYDNALEGMYQISLEGKIIQLNNAMARLIGFESQQELLDSDITSWRQIWINENVQNEYLALLEKKEVVFEFESQCKRQDGELFWMSTNTRIVRDKMGNKLHYEGFALDITKRKENELTIQKKVEELQWYYDIAISRELKMVELKKEINELLKKGGKDVKY